ncbi:hypothetical protein D3C85_1449680 [compost metagenome]
MDTRVAEHLGEFQRAVEALTKLNLAAGQRRNAPLPRRPVTGRCVEQRLNQPVVAQSLLELLRAVVVGKQVFHRFETVGRRRREAIQKLMFRIKHTEIGSKTRHVNSLKKWVRRKARSTA